MSRDDYPRRSRFVYGTGGDVTDWETKLPAEPWEMETPTVGGSKTSAAGVPAAYVVRRDHLLRLPLRLRETELEDLAGLIEWGQSAESFLWYPDANDSTVSFLVYLEEPIAGQPWRPVRDPDYFTVFRQDIALRAVVGSFWDLEYFPNVGRGV
jgi:hypothetical protein